MTQSRLLSRRLTSCETLDGFASSYKVIEWCPEVIIYRK